MSAPSTHPSLGPSRPGGRERRLRPPRALMVVGPRIVLATAALVLGVAARIADRALAGGAADVTTVVLVALMLVCIGIGATSWFRRSQR